MTIYAREPCPEPNQMDTLPQLPIFPCHLLAQLQCTASSPPPPYQVGLELGAQSLGPPHAVKEPRHELVFEDEVQPAPARAKPSVHQSSAHTPLYHPPSKLSPALSSALPFSM